MLPPEALPAGVSEREFQLILFPQPCTEKCVLQYEIRRYVWVCSQHGVVTHICTIQQCNRAITLPANKFFANWPPNYPRPVVRRCPLSSRIYSTCEPLNIVDSSNYDRLLDFKLDHDAGGPIFGGHGGLLSYDYDDVVTVGFKTGGAVGELAETTGGADGATAVDMAKDDDEIGMELEFYGEKDKALIEVLQTAQEGFERGEFLQNYLQEIDLQKINSSKENSGEEELTIEDFRLSQSEMKVLEDVYGIEMNGTGKFGARQVQRKRLSRGSPREIKRLVHRKLN